MALRLVSLLALAASSARAGGGGPGGGRDLSGGAVRHVTTSSELASAFESATAAEGGALFARLMMVG
jgi:hypothetical protein